jgi:hypothetical protein
MLTVVLRWWFVCPRRCNCCLRCCCWLSFAPTLLVPWCVLFKRWLCCCTALISDSSRSVEICSFLGLVLIHCCRFWLLLVSLQDPFATVRWSDIGSLWGLGLFGSKGPFIPAVLCHRGLWYVNLSVLTVVSFAVLTLVKARTSLFFLFGFGSVRVLAG